jgi:ribonucleoside-diphosphate reductase alpha chain
VPSLGAFDSMEKTPLLDALLSRKEPKTGPDGTMSWTVDVLNAATDDDFVLGVKELTLPDGQRRPYSVWMAGTYPRAFDGLCITLSYDMRIYDPAWIGKKLRQLLDYAEPLGDFMARVPGEKRQTNYPSTVAYVVTLLLHRYVMLSVLDQQGRPIEDLGALTFDSEADDKVVPLMPQQHATSVGAMEVMSGKRCPECNSWSVIRKDGCDFCTSCGYVGACG